MIRFEEVSYSYDKQKLVLNRVNLEFPDHGFVLIKGKSGSGKTTLINLLSGLDTPSSGRILFENEELKGKVLSEHRRQNVGVVFQELNLIRNLSIENNLKIAFEASGFEYDVEESKRLLEVVGLKYDEIASSFPNELSGGQQQRIALVRSLVKKPKILVLDEPTSALDYDNADDVLKILKKLSEKILVVVASHDLLRLEKIATKIISLDEQSEKHEAKEINLDALPCESAVRTKKTLSLQTILPFVFSLRFKNRFRIIGSIIATVILTIMICFSSCLVFTDTNRVLLNAQSSMNPSYFSLSISKETYNTSEYVHFEKDLEKKMVEKGYYRFSFVGKTMALFQNDDSAYSDRKISFFTHYGRDNYAAEIDDNLGLAFDNRFDIGKQHLPNDFGEIAVTSSVANFLVGYAYEDKVINGGQVMRTKKYSSVADLMEKGYCYGKKITAILKTPDQSHLDFLENSETSSENKLNGFTIAKCVFVKKGYNAWLQTQSNDYNDFSIYDNPWNMLGKIKSNKQATLKELSSFTYEKEGSKYSVEIKNLYSEHIYFAREFKLKNIPGKVLFAAAIFMSLISFLISASLFSSITKKDDVSLGIMHSLGANSKSIALITFTALAVLQIIELLMFSIAYVATWLIINAIISTEFSFFSFLSLPLLFTLLSQLVISVLSVLPGLKKAITVKPINMVREYNK